MTTTVPRRRRSVIAVLVAGILVLGGCSSSGPPTGAPTGASASDAPVVPPPAPGTVDGRFPVTVVHGYGETVVPAAPRRVVVDAGADLDALLALGVRPVATTQVPQPQPSWTSARLGGRPLDQVVQMPGVPGFVYAGTQTGLGGGVDLISRASDPISRESYDADRTIAPTITPPAGIERRLTTWQDTTRLVGQAVGRPVEAERLVDDVEARIASAPSRYPQLVGHTGACVTLETGKSSMYRLAVDGPGGRCGRVLAWLGMRGVPALETAPSDQPYRFTGADIAAARPDVVVLADRDGIRDTVRELLPPGLRVVDLSEFEQRNLQTYDTVLSIPVLLDRFPPKLVRALGS